MALIIECRVSQGRFDAVSREAIQHYLQSNEGVLVRLEIKRSKAASLKQYGFLFGVVYPILQNAFYLHSGLKPDINDIDIFMKYNFWKSEIVDYVTAEIIQVPNSKTNMNMAQLAKFISDCMDYGIEHLGCEFPDPNDCSDFAIIENENNT